MKTERSGFIPNEFLNEGTNFLLVAVLVELCGAVVHGEVRNVGYRKIGVDLRTVGSH